MDTAQPSLIALDWGTSALRAYLLGPDGSVIDQAAAPCGVLHLAHAGFRAAFDQAVGAWRARWPGLNALASGMVGSTEGWVEAPYADCPAGAGDLAGRLARVPEAALWVVPGVAQRTGTPNVLRGEETQVFGTLHLRPALRDRARLLLPGTHSKWIDVEAGRIMGFDTYMTGELFAVLRGHSILGRLAKDLPPPGDEAAREAFERGVAAGAGGPVTALLFSARALVLTGHLRREQSLDYLSGLLIGDELRGAMGSGSPLALIGDPALCARYRQAMRLIGAAEAPIIDAAEATAAGLWDVARQAGLTKQEGMPL